MSRKAQVAAAFREIGAYLRVVEPKSFRARAYERGALAIESAAGFEKLVDDGRLHELPGIGMSLSAVAEEVMQTGKSRLLERLRAEVPRGVVALAAVRGISVARARKLHEGLAIETVEALLAACREGRVQRLPGFAEKSERRILEQVVQHLARQDRAIYRVAQAEGAAIEQWLHEAPGVVRVARAGDLAQCADLVSALDFVVASDDVARVERHLTEHPRAMGGFVEHVGEDGVAERVLRFSSAPPIRLHVVPAARFGWALLSHSAAPAHVRQLSALAAERGIDVEASDAVDESAIYERLGMPWIPPEVRHGDGEIEAALAGDDFADLIREEDIRGAVHCHTTDSDGRLSILEMAVAARALGMGYITITDHSKAAFYAGGLDDERLAVQRVAIAEAQAAIGPEMRILAGTESDILPDGRLDYEPETLATLDVVIGSVHARNGQSEGAMTERLLSFMRQPYRKIWGHPLGRLLMLREPIACRLDEILDAARETDTVIEINGDSHRLDMPPEGIRAARRRGLRFVISADAHSARGLEAFRNGVAMARRGGVRRHEVVNAYDVDTFTALVSPRVAQQAPPRATTELGSPKTLAPNAPSPPADPT